MSLALPMAAVSEGVVRNRARWLWMVVLLVTAILAVLPVKYPAWLLEVPRPWRLGWDKQISAFMNWLAEDASFGLFTFRQLTRGISWLLDWPLHWATMLLATGLMDGQGSTAVQVLPPLPWLAVVLGAAMLGWHWGGPRLALLGGASFLYLAVFGQWASAMVTLASIAIAVPIGIALGLLLGIAGHRSQAIRSILLPILDLMQTVPIFAYLVPILFLFGFGPVAATLATITYAMPPMVRVTMQGLGAVPTEIVEYGRMAGCTERQMTWKVLVPAARPTLLVGVNQVIMLSLNMVIIASMIGAGGLGYDVLTSLRRLDIGGGLEAGLAIVLLAVALDRLSRAAHDDAYGRHKRFWIAFVAAIGGIYLAGLVVPAIAIYPAGWTVSTGAFWSDLVAWLNVHFFDALEAIKTAIVLNLLVPVRRFLTALPWPWVLLVVALLGWRLGGVLLAAMCLAFGLFIVLNGQWQNAMQTVYLCGVSVLIAAAIGIPLGIASGLSRRTWQVMEAVIDTLQTLPSFVYLIPVVMLFRVGDFTAMIAVVLYALAPAVRYTAHGIRQIQPALIEAGTASGCTPWQMLTRIRLPLARPDILLGINQTIMLALSMLVITALVGTRDLGQEVYVALTKADTGRGIVAGLCVAFIAIVADRLIQARAAQLRPTSGGHA
ncbi:MAG TPA: ABC transporter permease subunit [Geminicoccus sp.]|jgi:glycine betaine/proline transport system permease protein|uniref:ABC transporter permease n=1 Tax=Geminicoccus sp. TaxID=2024832 RepID=UPI002E366F6D|nr:ABC transporter permease subunit [Geminicoccus sp.]HEX2526458.1 ABC transporter permease subunit [Geminicoccus sp.]